MCPSAVGGEDKGVTVFKPKLTSTLPDVVISLTMFALTIYTDISSFHINLVHVHVVFNLLFSMVLTRVVHSGQYACPSVGMCRQTCQRRVCCGAGVSRRNASPRERRASGPFIDK